MIRIAFDTNILAYLAGVNRHSSDGFKVEQSRALLKQLRGKAALVTPVQTLGELFIVLLKAGSDRSAARDTVMDFHRTFGRADSGSSALVSALDLAATHKLQIWDALILNAAVEAGCAMLLSEDMQHGFTWRGLSVVNPFRTPIDAQLAELTQASTT